MTAAPGVPIATSGAVSPGDATHLSLPPGTEEPAGCLRGPSHGHAAAQGSAGYPPGQDPILSAAWHRPHTNSSLTPGAGQSPSSWALLQTCAPCRARGQPWSKGPPPPSPAAWSPGPVPPQQVTQAISDPSGRGREPAGLQPPRPGGWCGLWATRPGPPCPAHPTQRRPLTAQVHGQDSPALLGPGVHSEVGSSPALATPGLGLGPRPQRSSGKRGEGWVQTEFLSKAWGLSVLFVHWIGAHPHSTGRHEHGPRNPGFLKTLC